MEKIAAIASARRNAWKTRASARSRRPAPSARATADETPAPIPLLVVCRIIITQGNASEAPASALVPMRPRRNPSNVITPANASRVRMFGAARRSNVGRIGPSSKSLVRAAVDGVTPLVGADDDWEIEALRSLIGAPPPEGVEPGLGTVASVVARWLRNERDGASLAEAGRIWLCRIILQLIISWACHRFSYELRIWALLLACRITPASTAKCLRNRDVDKE